MPIREKKSKAKPAAKSPASPSAGRFRVRRLFIRTRAQADAAICSVEPCEESVPIMAPKLLFYVVKIYSVRAPMANILKQEALGMGAEAALSQWSVNCARPRTDVVLAGTGKHFSRLIAKMRQQGADRQTQAAKAEYFALAEEIEEAIKNG